MSQGFIVTCLQSKTRHNFNLKIFANFPDDYLGIISTFFIQLFDEK